jgi:hypothetical protein
MFEKARSVLDFNVVMDFKAFFGQYVKLKYLLLTSLTYHE